MVYLSRIYTRTGDRGTTALGNGKRVSKSAPRINAYGTVDELNSVLGMVLASRPPRALAGTLSIIQNDLFDLGADLCVPQKASEKSGEALRLRSGRVVHLELAIDRLNARLKPLHSFVLPGGTRVAAWLHLARTLCRRAERDVVALSQSEPVNSQVIMYLNRLSDLLFVMARHTNRGPGAEVLWVPGGAEKEQKTSAKRSGRTPRRTRRS
ncbi:MAG: cob(I)yrinic acid a,c-diamide adenosyltransferase [Acidobacteria bacterium]|nr:cob(I)yrinic acid a,c-diamide adenosyltransferase [Acidobacteriota bacterium]